MSTLKEDILKSLGRSKKDFTVREIYDRLCNKGIYDPYSSVRARVYEMANEGVLFRVGERRDKYRNIVSTTFSTSYPKRW